MNDETMNMMFKVESAIIAFYIDRQEEWKDAGDVITPDMFSVPLHKTLWSIMGNYCRNGKTWTSTLLASEAGVEPSVILGFDSWMPFSRDVRTEMKTMREYHLVRDLQRKSIKVFDNWTPGTDILDGVTDLRSDMERMTAEVKGCDVMRASEVATTMAASRKNGIVRTVTQTSFKLINDTAGGLMASKLYIVGARPSVGKTAITVQLAIDAARRGASCLLYTTESTKDEIASRMMANVSSIPSFSIVSSKVDPDEMLHAAELLPSNIYVSDRNPTIWSMLQFMRQWRKEVKGPAVIFVDYLELVAIPRKGGSHTRESEVSEIISLLQGASKELDVCMVVASQLNRELAREEKGSVPELHHLRSSGMIEQAADYALLLWQDKDGNRNMRVAKNKIAGMLGKCQLELDASVCRIRQKPELSSDLETI